MRYAVEYIDNGAKSEEDGSEFYRREKRPAWVSVTGFSTSHASKP